MMDVKGSTSDDVNAYDLHKEWDEISCPICMDHPHNAVLLLCSSHEKGCRPYMCDTSNRHSNCLDRFKKLKLNLRGTHEAYNLEESSDGMLEASEGTGNREPETYLEPQGQQGFDLQEFNGSSSVSEQNGLFKCPLCRGTVLGYRNVKEARKYLDLKPRSCSRESCTFSGTYRELRRHARRIHPMTRPADVDPSRQRAWRHLEREWEVGDVLSALQSTAPGAIVVGDVLMDSGDRVLDHESSSSGYGRRSRWTTFFFFEMISGPPSPIDEPRRSLRSSRTHRSSGHRNLWGENLLGLQDDDDDDDSILDGDITVPRRRRRLMRSRADDESHER
uniref:Zinc finger protein 62 n=1 Tax=Anthurium amnicola TaxID=1678845 RepID=A0A1D1XCJ6_9ARAE